MNSNSQSGQDIFVLKCLKEKQNGTFVEIGSNDPIKINNSYLLETKYNWTGIMVEYDNRYLNSYKQLRPNSYHVIQDATTINYKELFTTANLPINIDYLQIDLEVSNNSTLLTLEKLDNEVMNTYKFATITFEHDIYSGNYFDTRQKSRDIFDKRGYIRVFSDVSNSGHMYEDWYAHPDLVDINYINSIKRDTSLDWNNIITLL